MQIRLIHNGRDRNSLLLPMDARTIDLMLQYSIQLVRLRADLALQCSSESSCVIGTASSSSRRTSHGIGRAAHKWPPRWRKSPAAFLSGWWARPSRRETTFRSFAASEKRLGLFTHRDLSCDWYPRWPRPPPCQLSTERDPARVRAYSWVAACRRGGQQRRKLRCHAGAA